MTQLETESELLERFNEWMKGLLSRIHTYMDEWHKVQEMRSRIRKCILDVVIAVKEQVINNPALTVHEVASLLVASFQSCPVEVKLDYKPAGSLENYMSAAIFNETWNLKESVVTVVVNFHNNIVTVVVA